MKELNLWYPAVDVLYHLACKSKEYGVTRSYLMSCVYVFFCIQHGSYKKQDWRNAFPAHFGDNNVNVAKQVELMIQEGWLVESSKGVYEMTIRGRQVMKELNRVESSSS